MLIGAATVCLVAHQPISYVVGVLTILFLLAGYGIERVLGSTRIARYIETICLSITAFLLMVPTVSEILRRVPDGHPIVTDLKSPLLLGAQAGLLAILVVGLTAQMIYLIRQNKNAAN